MVVVEAVDELLAVDVAQILRAGVPQGDMGVDDEEAVVVFLIHGLFSFQSFRLPPPIAACPRTVGTNHGPLTTSDVSIWDTPAR